MEWENRIIPFSTLNKIPSFGNWSGFILQMKNCKFTKASGHF